MHRKTKRAINSLQSINLNDSVESMNMNEGDKVCLIVCNPYFSQKIELGQPVVEDCKLIEKIYLNHDYKCFNIVDASKEDFKKAYKKAIATKLEDFVLYYSGHGIGVEDEENSEEDGKDECLVFKDGYIADDYLSSKFEKCVCKEILFIFDCCHSGTLADTEHLREHEINLNVTSISGCADDECSIQLRNNGIFTYHINHYQELPLKEIIEKTNLKTQRFKQHLQISGTREVLCK